jgi:hypothetical protein
MPRSLICFLVLLTPAAASAQDVTSLLAKIKSVGKEGAGNIEAAKAWKELTNNGPDVLIDVLTAFDDANPVAVNYLRSAVETIAERSLAGKKPLPAAKLEAFVKDTKHHGGARKLAFDYLVRVDPTARARLLPAMLDDPGQELRREAVAVSLETAQKVYDNGDKAAAISAYQKALQFARDRDQLLLIGKRLDALDVKLDLTKHLGFVTHWMLIGPFDNRGGKGFATVFAPEKGIDLKATLPGKDGKKIGWVEHRTQAQFGMVDLNKVFGDLKGATGYALAVVYSEKERPVELRAGSNNALVCHLNGQKVFSREEYHHGMEMDQHAGRGVLKAGRNEILLKVCQNEQTEAWAALWSFQLRVCDDLGARVPVTVDFGRVK